MTPVEQVQTLVNEFSGAGYEPSDIMTLDEKINELKIAGLTFEHEELFDKTKYGNLYLQVFTVHAYPEDSLVGVLYEIERNEGIVDPDEWSVVPLKKVVKTVYEIVR